MPSTATITAFYSFTAGTVIRSAYVNANFSNFRGHIIPVHPTAETAGTTMSYDLGSTEYRWRNVYGKNWPHVVSTTGSFTLTQANDVVLMNSASGTLTATLPTAVGNTGLAFTIINIGNSGSNTVLVDANSTETIDRTLTVNLIDNEAIRLYSDGANWWSGP